MVVGLMFCVQLASQAVTLPELLALSCTKNQFKHEIFFLCPGYRPALYSLCACYALLLEVTVCMPKNCMTASVEPDGIQDNDGVTPLLSCDI